MTISSVTEKQFVIAGDAIAFPAAAFDTPWNGWTVPIVDRGTALAAMARLNDVDDERELTVVPDGDALVLTERYRHSGEFLATTRLVPTEGLYRLALGFTFMEREAVL